MRTIVTSCKKSNEKLFQLFPPIRQNLWALGKGVSNINLGIYSQLWPAAPRGFRQFSPGGAGQPVFPWGGASIPDQEEVEKTFVDVLQQRN